MEREELPEDVVRFIDDYVDTVPQLEALLLIWETAPRPWSAAPLAARVYVPPDEARRILQHLERARLVVADPAGGDGFVFAADHPESALIVHVARVYRSQLVRVAAMIHSKGSPAVREFARAFKIKRET